MDWTVPLAVRNGRDSSGVRFLCARNHVCRSNSKGNAHLGERSRSTYYYPSRRTFAVSVDRPRHMSLVEINCLGVSDRSGIGRSRGGLAYLTGYGHGPGSAAFEKLPLWLITLIVVRAGVVEELFYRGYAIDRLRMIGLGRFWSVTIPLVIFSIGHWSGGAANILIAFAAGLILTGFYLWRRDLAANMIGHGLVDFVANVVPRIFA